MSSSELYMAEQIMHRRMAERQLDLEQHELQKALGQPGWLTRQGLRLICQLGQLLVTSGERLVQYGPSKRTLVEGEMAKGN